MGEFLKKLSCLSLIVILSVSGLYTYETNASEEYDYSEKILNFGSLNYEEQKNLIKKCNEQFCREEDFIDKYFNAIAPFLISLDLENIVEALTEYYKEIMQMELKKVENGEPIEVPTWKIFKITIETVVIKEPKIVESLNLGSLRVRAIFALFYGLEF